ncbi:unnamed protein product [Haemonchus placei]|uniref:Cysteine-rich protein 1 n=1 Tax=Haemonchus placei TaxID=6290 RepID=A0A0N4W726_HAEPC|nr:unnamed protein product [Haemonchus placei]
MDKRVTKKAWFILIFILLFQHFHPGPFPFVKMPNCPACQKPVYFGERVSSLGKDWHRPCLRCANESCKKTLTSGGHSEHEGKPYCNRCYGAMFGPKGYGHGGTESHTFHAGATG